MPKALITFTPKEFDRQTLPEGTIIRFLGADYRIDYQDWLLAFEVLGVPPKEIDLPKVQFV